MATSKTLSTSVPETEQGTHVFRIVGYSQQWWGVGKPIFSGMFSVGRHVWVAILFPDGLKSPNAIDEHPVIAGVMLLYPGNTKAWASFELRLINQRTGLPFVVRKAAPREFSNDNAGGNYGVFEIKRSFLEAPPVLQDDCLTMEWIITVIKQPRISEVKSLPKIEVPPSDITLHFAKLLEEKEGVDITFSVGGQNIGAHKMVLAIRPPVFKAELFGPMREEGTEPIIVKDVQPDVFRALLHFIYTDSLPPLDDLEEDDHGEMIRHLLAAADRYAMERLKHSHKSSRYVGTRNVESGSTILSSRFSRGYTSSECLVRGWDHDPSLIGTMYPERECRTRVVIPVQLAKHLLLRSS